MNVTWSELQSATGPHGEYCQVWRCDEHPRVTRIRQRANADAEWVDLFYVEGLANHWHTVEDAIDAARVNP